MTCTLPCGPEFTVELMVVTVMPACEFGDPSVTVPDPEISLGDNVAVPFAGTTIVSGFKSHSAAGRVAVLPVITSSVAEYEGKVIVLVHACSAPATMLFGEFCESV